MTTLGGKTKKEHKPTQPQFVVQLAPELNQFLKLGSEIEWVGDPNAASKFDSKFAAKVRIRDLEDVPATRCFKEVA